MGITVQILGLIGSLSLLVFIHELGHYLFARLFNTRVDKFYLFFNPWFSIFKFKRGDTEWGLGWLPLGGYCKIAGMIDESMDKEQMKQEPQPWEYRSKPAWQRFFIISGGVIFNFILAMIIYAVVLFTWGKEYLPIQNATYGAEWDSIALNIGFKNGDKILSIDTMKVKRFEEITSSIVLDKAKYVEVERNNEIVRVPIPADFTKTLLDKSVKSLVMPLMPFVIDSIIPDMPAAKAGLKKEDHIIALNGTSLQSFFGFTQVINQYKNKKIDLQVLRNNDTLNLTVAVNSDGKIGVGNKPLDYFFKLKKVEYGFFESIPAGIIMGVSTLTNYIKQLPLIFSKEGAKHVGGFGTITSLFPKTWDWQSFWMMSAFISIMLAFINILPIPALDGGYLVFILYEMIFRRKPSDKFMEYAVTVGWVLLLGLMIFANGNDILRAFK